MYNEIEEGNLEELYNIGTEEDQEWVFMMKAMSEEYERNRKYIRQIEEDGNPKFVLMTDDEYTQWAEQNGKTLNQETMEQEMKQLDRLFETSKEDILKGLIPKHINVQVWQFLLESYASEQAARMLAMENATENAGEMIKDLGLQYNKARQSAITTEIIEIVSGANALSS